MKYLSLIFLFAIIVIAIYSQIPDNKLHTYICDVGQGDGILITKGQTQIVIDAGPDNSIENCLGKHMPFWDRTIEVAIMTHADSDHSYGFLEMIKRYKINNFFASPVDSNSSSVHFELLKNLVKAQTIHVIPAVSQKAIKFDEVDVAILFPDEPYFQKNGSVQTENSVLGSVHAKTNDFCAITFLRYKNFTALFACDTTPASEAFMLSEGIVPHAYFIKVPHHGSKNGLTKDFLSAVSPKLAAISVGAKNRYGHPSPEVVDMLQNFGVKTYRTDNHGEIEIKTDGEAVWVK